MTQPDGAARPLPCTKCGTPVGLAEDFEGYLDWGAAMVDADGTVHPAVQHFELHKGDPVRVRAVCPKCGHQWTLRRRFEPERGEELPLDPLQAWQTHG